MGFLDRFKPKAETKSATVTLADPSALSLLFGYAPTASGAAVSPETALRCPAVYASIRVIAESIAQLPLKLYRHLPDGGKEPATDHPLYDLLHFAPNSFTTSVEWRLASQSTLSQYGNAYSYISRNSDDSIAELIFLHPTQVSVEVDLNTQEPVYRVTDLAGHQNIYSRREVFHLRTFGTGQLSGYLGTSPILQAREAIGLAMQLEEHAARMFSNGARPAGVFKYPKAMSEKIMERLKESFATNYQGGSNSGKTMILEDGMTFDPLQFTSVDAQFLELRQFAIAEIARVYRIPLHLLGELSRSTNNNIAEQGRNFVQLCLMPLVKTWEAAISLSLLSRDERKTYFAEFDLDDFLRTDIEKRFAAYAVAVTNGVLNPNECRAMENLPSYVGGETYTRQLNTAPTSPAAEIRSAKR